MNMLKGLLSQIYIHTHDMNTCAFLKKKKETETKMEGEKL